MRASHLISFVCLFVFAGWSDALMCQDCNTVLGNSCDTFQLNYKTTSCDGLCYSLAGTIFGISHTMKGCESVATKTGCSDGSMPGLHGKLCYCGWPLCNLITGASGDGSSINSKQRHVYVISIAAIAFITLISRWTIL